MGFLTENKESLINDESKVRISLSIHALLTIASDMEKFGIKKTASFINTVFANYWENANASLSQFKEQRKAELKDILSEINLNSNTKENIIDCLLSDEINKIQKHINSYYLSKTTSRLYHINKNTKEILDNTCNEEKYYSRPGLYIRSIIEEYCTLPFIQRERIFHKDLYNCVETACIEKKVLKIAVEYNNQKTYLIVYPYRIVPDPHHTQSYLVCYSKKEDEEESQRKIASFNMTRLKMPYMYKRTFRLNKQEIANIENSIVHYSPAYLLGQPERIEIKLTENGKHIYQMRLFNKPEKIEELSTNDIYVFECTQRQVFNFFFSFGADAEVISPPELRTLFSDTYKNALALYNK